MNRLVAFLALLLVSGAALAQDYGGIPERFFGYLAKGQTDEAIDFLYATNKWVERNGDQVTNLKGELKKLNGLVGRYLFHERIVEQRVGERYAHLIYLAGYERQPLRFELKMYRPESQWVFYGVSFDTSLTKDIDKAANERLGR